MVTNQVQKRVVSNKPLCLIDGIGVASRFWLFNELQTTQLIPGRRLIGSMIARLNHHADLFHAGGDDFLNN